jgi:hypothetical protein
VKRSIGEDFWLHVIESPEYPSEKGTHLTLAQWYDRMKATISLEPISNPEITLDPEEQLFLASMETSLLVDPKDPIVNDIKDNSPRIDRYTQGIVVGKGRVFLTNHRFIWQGGENWRYDFPLTKINSVYIAADQTLVVLYELRILDLRFKQESMLMWLTYFGHVGKMIQKTHGHLITTSNY